MTKVTAGNGNGSSGDNSSDEVVAVGGEFTFVSQSFFMCWRGLHLGIVTAINDFHHVVRYWGNYLHDLDSGHPQQISRAQQRLASRWCLTAILVNKPLLQDLVTFCEAAAYSLLGALCGYDVVDGTHAASSSVANNNLEGSWLVASSDCPPSQLALLASLPEHLVEDIVAILLFVAKTEPSILSYSTTSLRSTLSLVLFLLRRPWAVQSPHLRAKLGHLLWKVAYTCLCYFLTNTLRYASNHFLHTLLHMYTPSNPLTLILSPPSHHPRSIYHFASERKMTRCGHKYLPWTAPTLCYSEAI